MLPYIALLIAFSATLVGIYGDTVTKQRRLTRNGWIAIAIAAVGLLVGGALQLKSDLAETENERRKRELQGVALIQLQQAVNEHIGLWRNLKEDGWDPRYYGESSFEVPGFLNEGAWQSKVNSKHPDHLEFRRSYQALRDRTIETLLLYRDVIDPNVLVAASKFHRQPMAEYFINWPPHSPLSGRSLGELEEEFRANPIGEVIQFSGTLRAKYESLGLPKSFEQQNRETGHVKDDRH